MLDTYAVLSASSFGRHDVYAVLSASTMGLIIPQFNLVSMIGVGATHFKLGSHGSEAKGRSTLQVTC
jgi:hypothetical protein